MLDDEWHLIPGSTDVSPLKSTSSEIQACVIYRGNSAIL